LEQPVGISPERLVSAELVDALGCLRFLARLGVEIIERKMAVDPGDLAVLSVFRHEPLDRRGETLAEGTLEIRELDHLYRSIEPADNVVLAVDRLHAAGCLAPLLLLGLFLLHLELLQRLDDHFRIVEYVFVHDLLDLSGLLRIEAARRKTLIDSP